MSIIIYTKRGCSWCADVLSYLRSKAMPFEEREVLGNPSYFEELLAKSGQMKTPTLDIDGFILADTDREAIASHFEKKF